MRELTTYHAFRNAFDCNTERSGSHGAETKHNTGRGWNSWGQLFPKGQTLAPMHFIPSLNEEFEVI